MFQEFDLAIQATVANAPLVQMWMNWMMGIMLVSIFFVWKHVGARYVLASMFLMIPLAITIFKLTWEIHLIGIAHIILWWPLLWYLIKREKSFPWVNLKSPYSIWTLLVSVTIIISLLFDIRDIVLVLTWQK